MDRTVGSSRQVGTTNRTDSSDREPREAKRPGSKRFRRQDSGEGGEICERAKDFQCADLGNVFGRALFQDEEVLRRTPGVFVVLLFV